MTSNHRRLVACSGALLCAVTMGVGVHPASADIAPLRPKATVTDPRLLDHYAVLRQAPDASENAIPASFVSPLDTILGANPLLARRALGPTSGQLPLGGIWLLPGTDSLSMVVSLSPPVDHSPGAAFSADSVRRALRRGGVGVLGAADHGILVTGFMPDGVLSVAVHRAHGKDVKLRVRHNVFQRVFRAPVKATWKVRGKRYHQGLTTSPS